MGYQTIWVEYELGDFKVPRDAGPPQIFADLGDLLDHFTAQGWQLMLSMPKEWRWLYNSSSPTGPLEKSGLELARFWLIFRRD